MLYILLLLPASSLIVLTMGCTEFATAQPSHLVCAKLSSDFRSNSPCTCSCTLLDLAQMPCIQAVAKQFSCLSLSRKARNTCVRCWSRGLKDLNSPFVCLLQELLRWRSAPQPHSRSCSLGWRLCGCRPGRLRPPLTHSPHGSAGGPPAGQVQQAPAAAVQ